MNASKYLKGRIDFLVNKFSSIKCSYEYDRIEQAHIIEVLPGDLYNNEIEFNEIEGDIYCEFFALFPYEGLFFITQGSVAKVKTPIYIKAGADYGKKMADIENSSIYNGLIHNIIMDDSTTLRIQPVISIGVSANLTAFDGNYGLAA